MMMEEVKMENQRFFHRIKQLIHHPTSSSTSSTSNNNNNNNNNSGTINKNINSPNKSKIRSYTK
jgi:hypothetical protein